MSSKDVAKAEKRRAKTEAKAAKAEAKAAKAEAKRRAKEATPQGNGAEAAPATPAPGFRASLVRVVREGLFQTVIKVIAGLIVAYLIYRFGFR